jgi:predicted O-methyltransferase YrrM
MQANAPQQHNCTALELYTLAVITKVISPQRALEIGTFDGRSTLAIAMNSEGSVYTLNLPPTEDPHGSVDAQLSTKVTSGARFLEHSACDRIEQLWGDSRDFDFAPYRGVQLIFIDGAHDAPTVHQDTATALKLIDRDNGAIVWHDALSYGVGEVLPEWVADGYPIHVIRGTEIALLRWSNGEPTTFTRATAAYAPRACAGRAPGSGRASSKPTSGSTAAAG